MVMEVEGPLFFASSFHLRQVLSRLGGYRCVVLDMAGMPFLDVTGTEILEEGVLLLKRQGSDVLLARPTDSVRERLRNLARSQFHALLECPVYDDLRDAMLHAAKLVEPDHLCGQCRGEGQCRALDRALKAAVTTGEAAEPLARALVAAENALASDIKEPPETRKDECAPRTCRRYGADRPGDAVRLQSTPGGVRSSAPGSRTYPAPGASPRSRDFRGPEGPSMSSVQRVGDLEIEQDHDFQRRSWRLQRAGWIVLVLVLLAGMLGLFGSGPLAHATVGAPGAPLRLEYDRFCRNEAPSTLTALLRPSTSRPGEAILHLDRGFTDHFQIERVQPTPDRTEAGPDHSVYAFRVTGPGEPVRVTFRLRPEQIGPLTGLRGRMAARG